MNETRAAGTVLLLAGLGVGALADGTLRTTPWGLNAAVMAVVTVTVAVVLQHRHQTRPGLRSVLALAAALAAAAAFVWRDALVLKVLNGLGVAVALGLLASEREAGPTERTLTGYAGRLAGVGVHTAYGAPIVVLSDVAWHEVRVLSAVVFVLRLLRALALAAPIVGTFALLLANADAIFASWLARWLDIDLAVLIGHLCGTVAWAWVSAGFLRAAVRREPAWGPPGRPQWLGWGRMETTVILGLVDLLFGAFVWIQLRYLFGGDVWVQRTDGLTYAEFARRGFFELVAVTALVLPLLLVAQWMFRPRAARERALFAALAGVQVGLVLLMLVSALQRMRLYRDEYGLTQLRLYTTAFMLWLGLLLVWFLMTAMFGRRSAFARGALASALGALLALNAADPERLIVETNRDHPRAFDVDYVLGLSADAVPGLLEVLPRLGAEARPRVARELLARRTRQDGEDWRTWSVARARARRELDAALPRLRELAGSAEVAAR